MSETLIDKQAATSDNNKENVSDEKGVETAEADASLLRKMLRNKLDETNLDIEVERRDPKSPLYSAKTFEELKLSGALLRGIYAMGFTKPSRIQETVLPCLLEVPGTNLIAQSQSGTGKTAAFVLTMLSKIDVSLEYPQAVCLAPTHELAAQIHEVVTKMGQFMDGLRISLGIKGQMVTRRQPLQTHIVIGTPGTVLDWSNVGRFQVFDLSRVKAFVLDEADVMISQQGHQDFCIRIHKGLKPKCQMMFFSATYNATVMEFASKIIDSPMVIRLRKQDESLNYIKQFFVTCRNYDEKCKVVYDVFGQITIGQTIIFCQVSYLCVDLGHFLETLFEKTKKTASDLAALLTRDGISVELLSGDLDVQQRAAVIERFRDGKSKMLVTTNVTARGIDIDDVKLVVNFDLPIDFNTRQPDFETYLHRIGRTGRFGKPGIAINLVEPYNMNVMEKISTHFEREIRPLNASDPEELEKKLGNLNL